MLNALLKNLGLDRPHSVRELAHNLGVSRELVEAMLENLVQQGYLRRVDRPCSHECADCPSAASCAAPQSGALWALTDAGRRATARHT
jgi:hypothetical protein